MTFVKRGFHPSRRHPLRRFLSIRLEEMNMDRRGRKKRVEALEQCLKALKLFQAEIANRCGGSHVVGWRGWVRKGEGPFCHRWFGGSSSPKNYCDLAKGVSEALACALIEKKSDLWQFQIWRLCKGYVRLRYVSLSLSISIGTCFILVSGGAVVFWG